MAQQALDQPVYTYRDYLTWPEGYRCELIDGRIVAMAPVPSLDHQTVVVELTAQIASQLRGKPCRVLSKCRVRSTHHTFPCWLIKQPNSQ